MYNHEKQTSSPVEIDFLVKPTELATVRYQPCEPVEEFFGNAQDLGGFQDRYFSGTSFTVFQSILQTLFTHGVRELAHIDKKIAEISDAVFAGKEKQMIKNISLVKRDILDFRRITKPMEGLLKVMEHELPHIFPEDRAPSMGVLLDDYENLKDVVGNLKDTVDSLESTNQTLLSAKIGEVMRMISLIAFVLAPVNIIAALFTMNAQFAPVIGQPYDWWIIIGMMGTGCAFLFLFFRAKKWF
jgi:magnesium transporter